VKIQVPFRRRAVNRRNFLRGAGGVAIGLPFLEGLPERSAWAADSPPNFAFFIVAACGVVGSRFFPNSTGALTADSLASSGKATAKLSAHAQNLLFVRGVNFPMGGPSGCGHAQGLCQALTATTSGGSGAQATSNGPSADWVISQKLADGVDPLNLYAGNRRNGYIAERISFKAGGAGQVRSADDNPYNLYSKLVGLVSPDGTPTPGGGSVAQELAETRNSVNDLVRDELNALMNNPALSAEDRARLDQHFTAIRDAEVTMDEMATTAACTYGTIDITRIQQWEGGFAFSTNGMIEEVAKLHMGLVALAFACGFSRVAAMQWGDGTDATKYDVPSNASLGWPFHHLSHRVASDSATGSNATAENAHAEIDALRMETLAAGLDQFAARGLQDKGFVMWTNHVSDGPSHSFRNVPHIIWGNGGNGYLKQGQYVDAANSVNNKLFNTLITAATQDTGTPTEDFGDGSGQLDAIRA
jgi:hypothetical protein